MPQYHFLHGAALTWYNQGIVLAGAAGRGKTSLAVALVKQGCQFLTDDVACLNLTTGQLEPFPRSLNLRQRGLSLLQPLLGDKQLEHGPIDITELFPNSVSQTSPLHGIFLLKGLQPLPRLQAISQRQALWQLLPLSHTPVTKPAKIVWQLAPCLNSIPCYELVVGELEATATLILQQLDQNNRYVANG